MPSKKHFESIARIVNVTFQHQATNLDVCEGWNAAASSMAHRLADYFEHENPRFDRERFLKACGIVTAQAARAAA